MPEVNIVSSINIDNHLALLSRLDLPRVDISDKVDIQKHLKLLDTLTLPEIVCESEYAADVTEAFNELQLKSDIIECPIHGKVVSMYDKCLYID